MVLTDNMGLVCVLTALGFGCLGRFCESVIDFGARGFGMICSCIGVSVHVVAVLVFMDPGYERVDFVVGLPSNRTYNTILASRVRLGAPHSPEPIGNCGLCFGGSGSGHVLSSLV